MKSQREPILDRPLTPEEIDGCFWCRKPCSEIRAEGHLRYTHGELAKAGIEVHTCPEHAAIMSGHSGKILMAFYRLVEGQLRRPQQSE